jgi:hypothetical protein
MISRTKISPVFVLKNWNVFNSVSQKYEENNREAPCMSFPCRASCLLKTIFPFEQCLSSRGSKKGKETYMNPKKEEL